MRLSLSILSLPISIGASFLIAYEFSLSSPGQFSWPWLGALLLLCLFSLQLVRQALRPEMHFFWLPKLSSEPVSLAQTYSVSYMAAAVLIAVFAYFQLQNWAKPPVQIRQVVDIQLVSFADAQDKNSPLPGTAEKTVLKKRRADAVDQRGLVKSSVRPKNIAPKSMDSAKDSRPKPSEIKTAESEPSQIRLSERKPSESAVFLPKGWKTTVPESSSSNPDALNRSRLAYRPAEAFLEEVGPPELVELMENDGEEDSLAVFQDGGKSSGGKGAANGLSLYLKQLHKRIKAAWLPPKGDSSKLEVIFRLNRKGNLVSISVKRSSGNSEMDATAIKAIQLATRLPMQLPADYEPRLLDIDYRFNYRVDSLKEVERPSHSVALD